MTALRRLLPGVVLVMLLTTATAAAPDFAALNVVPYDPPKPAPEFSLPTPDGRTVALADLRGKVALVFFWATW
jgi:cytochrome oxidase Cu insertion factor (SCO1/SenC/PrrC family)